MKHVIRIRTIFLLLMASVLGFAHGSISSVVCKMACCQPAPVVEKIIVESAPLSCCHPVTLSPSIHFSSVISKKDDCCCKTAPHLVAPDQACGLWHEHQQLLDVAGPCSVPQVIAGRSDVAPAEEALQPAIQRPRPLRRWLAGELTKLDLHPGGKGGVFALLLQRLHQV